MDVPYTENQESLSYCSPSDRFVQKIYTRGESLCLHSERISEEQDEIAHFIQEKAHTVFIVDGSGKQCNYPIGDFTFISEDGYLEHNVINLAINLFQNIEHSYFYHYDKRGEVSDIEPLKNVIIL